MWNYLGKKKVRVKKITSVGTSNEIFSSSSAVKVDYMNTHEWTFMQKYYPHTIMSNNNNNISTGTEWFYIKQCIRDPNVRLLWSHDWNHISKTDWHESEYIA